VEDYLGPFRDLVDELPSSFERHVLVWCILNYVPLKQLCAGEAAVVFYEELCLNPEQELKRINAFLGGRTSLMDRRVWMQPSSQSRRDSPVITGGNLVESWTASITSDWINRAMEIVSAFGLDAIYTADPRPNLHGIDCFLGGPASAAT
jgi:hypothetical protein